MNALAYLHFVQDMEERADRDYDLFIWQHELDCSGWQDSVYQWQEQQELDDNDDNDDWMVF